MSEDQDFAKEMQKEFLDEVSYLIEQCEESYLKLENPQCRAAELDKIFRFVHSLKGTGAIVGFTDLASFAHVVEDCLSVLRMNPDQVSTDIISLLLKTGDVFKKRIATLKQGNDEPWDVSELKEEVLQATKRLVDATSSTRSSQHEMPAVENPDHKVTPQHDDTSATERSPHSQGTAQVSLVKIDPSRIDGVLDLVGELVVLKGQLLQVSANVTNPRHNEILGLLDKTIRELQDKTLFMRLTSIKPLFLRVQRVIRDLSVQLSKQVEFSMSGDDIEIDRTMIELLGDPLVHIARNAGDHGIEPAEARTLAGKPEKATVTMRARHSAGRVVIEIQDDGGGIDRDRVLKKARERNLVPAGIDSAHLSDQEIYNFLFMPGFSTAEKVTDVSGRGVGLDVVKTAVEKLKGTISIESKRGVGTKFQISVPLTTAITDGIIVMIHGHRFVVPMGSIVELVPIESKNVHVISQTEKALLVRNRTIPLIQMRDVLATIEQLGNERSSTPQDKRSMVLVIDYCGSPVALLVDGIIGQSQVVVKALPSTLSSCRGLAGASILGDGRIALVLDVDALAKNIRKSSVSSQRIHETAMQYGA